MSRFLLKKFAGSSTHSGQFGSFQADGGVVGGGTISSDPATIQNLPAWGTGWNTATNNALKIPRIEEMEGVQRVICESVYNNWVDGISFWQANMPVIANQTIVQFQTGSNKPKLYLNITGTNTDDDPEVDTTNWVEFLVDTYNDQTIAGTKTFSSVPSIPTSANTGSSSTDAVNVAYLHNNGYATRPLVNYTNVLAQTDFLTICDTTKLYTYTAQNNGYYYLGFVDANITNVLQHYYIVINTSQGVFIQYLAQSGGDSTGTVVNGCLLYANRGEIIRVTAYGLLNTDTNKCKLKIDFYSTP